MMAGTIIREGKIMFHTEKETTEHPILLCGEITKGGSLRQLEMSLESRKLNHLVKDVRQRGRGNQKGDAPQQAKIINMIRTRLKKEKNRKARETIEAWINTPITFPLVSTEDVSKEPLIVEAEVEGYLVRLKDTQTNLVGFAREVIKQLGKIELEVCFGNEGLSRRTTMKFTVIKAPSPYNIILGRLCLKVLRAIPSTIHSMMKFPIPKGITTLVTRSVIISECRRLEKKQMIEEKATEVERRKEEGGLSEECKSQLKLLLKNNMEIFAWEPTDMTGVPRRIIEYSLNVNASIELMCQKWRVLAPKKSQAVTREVSEWVKAGIV
ncbi:hypothetical protein Tco_0524764 [Tanacetum coccineum]